MGDPSKGTYSGRPARQDAPETTSESFAVTPETRWCLLEARWCSIGPAGRGDPRRREEAVITLWAGPSVRGGPTKKETIQLPSRQKSVDIY